MLGFDEKTRQNFAKILQKSLKFCKNCKKSANNTLDPT